MPTASLPCHTDLMAKLSKKALSEFDEAIDQLGGGVLPIARPPSGSRKVAKPRKTAKPRKIAKSRTPAKAKPRKIVKAKARSKKR